MQNRGAVPPLSRNLRVSPDRCSEETGDPGFPVGEPGRPPGRTAGCFPALPTSAVRGPERFRGRLLLRRPSATPRGGRRALPQTMIGLSCAVSLARDRPVLDLLDLLDLL